MTPEQWERVQSVYYAALDCDSGRRGAFLETACRGDSDLRREVEALLAAHKQAGGTFLAAPALEAVAGGMAERGDSLVGQRLGHYQVLGRLGAGGMGEVYLAHDVELRRRVALKLLPLSLSRDEERVRRFEQEARAAAQLSHPNVCVIHEVGRVETGRRFIAMEYVEGETLRERLERGPIALGEALAVAAQVAQALGAAHAAGVVHRDIKPENIAVRRDGYVKVLDFGLAKLAERRPDGPASDSATSSWVQTETGIVMGTATYMSPEQARGEHVGPPSDVFSFGVVLYELLTGEQAFGRASAVEAMHAILHEEPAGLEALSRRIPAEVDRVLRRCLEKEPGRRYANGSELAAALAPLAETSRASAKAPTVSVVSGAGPRRARPWWLAAAVVAVLAGGGVWLRVWRPAGGAASGPAAEAPRAPMRTAPLTALRGSAWYPAFSPDGSEVAFVWGGEAGDNQDIYVKQLDSGTQVRLTTDPGADVCPVWSPDGRSIAFSRFTGEGPAEERSVIVVPAIGGPERKLVTASVARWPDSWATGQIDWPVDGTIVYSDASAVGGPWRLYRLSVDTLETEPLTSPPEGWLGDIKPTFSPDGQRLAFTRKASATVSDVYVMPAAGGEPRRLTFENGLIYRLTWTPDGRSIVFDSTRAGAGSLWRVPVDGGESEPLGVGGNIASYPTISRRGQRLAYVTTAGETSSFWRLGLAGPTGKAGQPTKLLSSAAFDNGPQISPDGKRIAFESTRSGSQEVWVCDADGANPLQLTKLGRPITGTPRWSPDGRFIAFDTRLEEAADVYVIGANGGVPRRLTDDPADDVVPSWSRDGRWIYFCSDRTGEYQVWKIPAEGGEAVQVTRQGGFAAFESPDGRYVYYAKGLNAPGLWRVPVEGGEEELVLDQLTTGWGQWAVVDDGVYFTAAEGKTGAAIDFYSFATRKVTPVSPIERLPLRANAGLAVSPDRRWLLYTQHEGGGSEIVLVENFR